MMHETKKAYINEFHSDNSGTDAGEFIEIASVGSIAGYTIVLYNGSPNVRTPYNIITPAPALSTIQDGITYTVFDYPVNGIQNGNDGQSEPDGIALVAPNGTVVEFLSYEGSFVAASGVAQNRTSVNLGVAESGTTPQGFSLQRDIVTGNWLLPRQNTRGMPNGTPPPAPAPASVPVSSPATGPAPAPVPLVPTPSVTLIHDIQGTGNPIVTPFFVNVEAIITSLFTTDDALSGFWMQEEDSDIDTSTNTSEGIFVTCGTNCPASLAVGSLIKVSGRAG
jgi:uncharacterized protein